MSRFRTNQELRGEEIEIKGWGTLWNFRGYKITGSRIFSEGYQQFDATGILFEECIFENCRPMFEHCTKLTYGCINCKIIREPHEG